MQLLVVAAVRALAYKVFIGWDSREDVAYQVSRSSILRRTEAPVQVFPLKQQDLKDAGYYTRPKDPLASTEFTFTRYLISDIVSSGWALFIDCDTVCLDDIEKLFDQRDDRYAVMCAKHDYTPTSTYKMDGQRQTIYPRKNWSSVMLINCSHPSNRKLTLDLVNNTDYNASYFHRFSWLDDGEIGEFSYEWNYLVGWYKSGNPKILHWTEGGPWFENHRNTKYADVWREELISTFS